MLPYRVGKEHLEFRLIIAFDAEFSLELSQCDLRFDRRGASRILGGVKFQTSPFKLVDQPIITIIAVARAVQPSSATSQYETIKNCEL